GCRGRFRRHDHGRRLHHQEPERDVDVRLRPVVLGRLTLAIDLHTHTTASDGTRAPADLPACAARAGVTVLSVTDHDTVAACDAAAAACAAAGIEFVTGIEISAVRDDVD